MEPWKHESHLLWSARLTRLVRALGCLILIEYLRVEMTWVMIWIGAGTWAMAVESVPLQVLCDNATEAPAKGMRTRAKLGERGTETGDGRYSCNLRARLLVEGREGL